MLKSPPSWKWTGGSFQKHSHSEWILRIDRGEKFPKFNQSYGKAFESSCPSSPHNHSFVCGHLNNWNEICGYTQGSLGDRYMWLLFNTLFYLSPCTFHRRPDQAGKTVWTESSDEIFQCAKSFLITCSSEQIKTLWGSAPTLIFWNRHFCGRVPFSLSFYSPHYLWSKSSL